MLAEGCRAALLSARSARIRPHSPRGTAAPDAVPPHAPAGYGGRVTLTLSLTLIGLVLVCAIIQRVAGMGLGIVFAPYAVVLIGARASCSRTSSAGSCRS